MRVIRQVGSIIMIILDIEHRHTKVYWGDFVFTYNKNTMN